MGGIPTVCDLDCVTWVMATLLCGCVRLCGQRWAKCPGLRFFSQALSFSFAPVTQPQVPLQRLPELPGAFTSVLRSCTAAKLSRPEAISQKTSMRQASAKARLYFCEPRATLDQGDIIVRSLTLSGVNGNSQHHQIRSSVPPAKPARRVELAAWLELKQWDAVGADTSWNSYQL